MPRGEKGTSRTRVAVVAATQAYAEAVGAVLAQQDDLEVTATASTLADVLYRIEELASDIVVLDVGGSANGSAIRELRKAAPVRVLVLGISASEAEIVACARAGASGFVGCQGSLEQLATAVRTVARGEVFCCPAITAVLLGNVSVDARPSNGETHLTPREVEVLELIDEGLSNKQIAQRLQIGVATVKNHVHNVLAKLNVHGRLEAAARVRAGSNGSAELTRSAWRLS
jgi:two-component system nitrate/nitrite response regulator NarL